MLNDFKFRANVLITSALYFLRILYISYYENINKHILKGDVIMILGVLTLLVALIVIFVIVAIFGGVAIMLSYLDIILVVFLAYIITKKLVQKIRQNKNDKEK